MKNFLKYSILNVIGKDIMIHIVLPISIVILGILFYITNLYIDMWAIGMLTTMALSMIVIGWFNYTSYPKDHRISFHYEFLPVIAFGIVTEKHIGIILPFVMISINFTHLYNFKKKLL